MMDVGDGSGGGMLKPEKIGDVIKFIDVVNRLEDICSQRTPKEKNAKIEKFIKKCREFYLQIHDTLNSDVAGGDSLFPVIRILLLQLDRERPAYGLKAHTLGRLLAKVLGLNDKDKLRLTKFKDIGRTGNEGGGPGDFASVLYSIMKSRFSDCAPSSISLTSFHEILDQLARTKDTDQAAQEKILQELFTVRKISPIEGKWLCRILLKNLEYGVSRNVIFKLIHPQAMEMYERVSNLKKVCETLNDPTAAVDVGGIVLFYYVKPMLCLRTNTLDDFDTSGTTRPQPSGSSRVPVRRKYSADSRHMAPPFVVETKWDGERFQIHYDGRVLKYMSKQGHDFTNNFNSSLTARFTPQILHGVRSFIIDGEMMAWNKRYKLFTQKGDQIDVKRLLATNPNHCPTYVAFDVLLYNEEILIDKPLHERMTILKKILKPKLGVLLLADQQVLDTREQVEEALNKAIDNLEEGLVIKSIDSTYMPGKRGLSWRKVKPEFIYGTSVDDLDLLILGAYYSDSTRRGGQVGSFLVGLINKSGDKEEFYALTEVGSGRLRSPQMNELIEELLPRLQKKKFPSVHYKSKQSPDLFIDPKKSIVVQVKGSEIKYSDAFALNYNLRFPRITRVRRDKNYHEVMTVTEFHSLRESTGGRLAKRTDGKAMSTTSTTRKRKSAENENTDTSTSDEDDALIALPKRNYNASLTTDPVEITTSNRSPTKSGKLIPVNLAPKRPVVKQDIFKSKVFCVYGSSSWKAKIEEEISSYGGQFVQNPVKEKFYIVGESRTNYKVDKAISSAKYDVLKPNWITRCIQEGSQIPLSPSDFYCYTEDTGELFKMDYDKYGDSYTKPVSLDEVKDLVTDIIKRSGKDRDSNDDDDADDDTMEVIREEMDAELFPGEEYRKIGRYRFFTNVKVAFRGPTDAALAAMVEFYGGTVASGETEDDLITHVIVKDLLSPTKRKQLSAILVEPEWIKACVRERKCLDELAYTANCLV